MAYPFVVAKITPTKIGQFVTLWKRSGKLPIQPFDLSIDFVVVSVRKGDLFGRCAKKGSCQIMPKAENEHSAFTHHGIIPSVLKPRKHKSGSWNISWKYLLISQ